MKLSPAAHVDAEPGLRKCHPPSSDREVMTPLITRHENMLTPRPKRLPIATVLEPLKEPQRKCPPHP
jgi:hypothetical protein